MTIRYDKRGRRRDYKKEYRRDHAPLKDRKDRAARSKARALLKIKKKGMQVHHKDGNPRNNARSNLVVVSRKKNTTLSNKARARS